MSVRSIGWAVAVMLLLPACAAEALTGDEPLEQLHGPIDPSVLDQQLDRPTPPPITQPVGATWRVSDVIDGRTLEVFQGLERVTVTMGGIEVPTGEECEAQLATDSLAFITGGGQEVEVTPSTPVGGLIADALVRNGDGDDLALVMITLGLAEVGVIAVPDPEAYASAEAAARDDELGIWSAECADASVEG